MKRKLEHKATIEVWGEDLLVTYIDANGIASSFTIPTTDGFNSDLLFEIDALKNELNAAGYVKEK